MAGHINRNTRAGQQACSLSSRQVGPGKGMAQKSPGVKLRWSSRERAVSERTGNDVASMFTDIKPDPSYKPNPYAR